MIFNIELLDRNTEVYFMHENKIVTAWIIDAIVNGIHTGTSVKYEVQIKGTAAKDRLLKSPYEIFTSKEELIKNILK